MHDVRPDSLNTGALLTCIARGDRQALDQLLAQCRPWMMALVQKRLDARTQARFGTSDVVQEVQAEILRRLEDFLRTRPLPFHLWVRRLTFQRLLQLRRHHLRSGRRSVQREMGWPEHSSVLISSPLLGSPPSPSSLAAAREQAERVAQAVSELPEEDREVLLMRHGEELPYGEIACLLDIDPAAARKRYGRALLRLRQVLAAHGLLEVRHDRG